MAPGTSRYEKSQNMNQNLVSRVENVDDIYIYYLFTYLIYLFVVAKIFGHMCVTMAYLVDHPKSRGQEEAFKETNQVDTENNLVQHERNMTNVSGPRTYDNKI